MTGYTVHTGSTKKFSEGWDRIFTGNSNQAAKKAATKKPAKRKAVAAKATKRTAKSKRG